MLIILFSLRAATIKESENEEAVVPAAAVGGRARLDTEEAPVATTKSTPTLPAVTTEKGSARIVSTDAMIEAIEVIGATEAGIEIGARRGGKRDGTTAVTGHLGANEEEICLTIVGEDEAIAMDSAVVAGEEEMQCRSVKRARVRRLRRRNPHRT